jgi:hypothetical protein
MTEKPDTELSEREIAERMERGLRRALKTPPQPHGPPAKPIRRRSSETAKEP